MSLQCPASPNHQIIRTRGQGRIPDDLQSDLTISGRISLQGVEYIDPYHKGVDRVVTVGASFLQAQVEVNLGVGADCHGERLPIRWCGVNPDQIILALDVDTAEEALSWASRLRSRVGTFKVGLQLYLNAGTAVLLGMQKMGVPVFLDLKFHDIPNTVAHAVAATARWKPRFLTVHASGGKKMMEAAVDAAAPETKVLGVTLLTSLDERAVTEVGWTGGVGCVVRGLSQLAKVSGLAGVVCSPQEAQSERSGWGRGAEIVTPGVRPTGFPGDDQARSKTAEEAIRDGASRIVVGRPVLKASHPEAILDQMLSAPGL